MCIVGHLFPNDVNQEQGNTIVKDEGSSSSEALLPLGINEHRTKVMHVNIIYKSMNIIHITLIPLACSKVLTRKRNYNSA
jgi:hypothetical protein